MQTSTRSFSRPRGRKRALRTLAALLLSTFGLSSAAQEVTIGEPAAPSPQVPRKAPPRTAIARHPEGGDPRGREAAAPAAATEEPTPRAPGGVGGGAPPPNTAEPAQVVFTDADGFTHFRLDVSVYCSFQDLVFQINIPHDPGLLTDISYSMTNFDVDFTDPGDCPGGPEIDRMLFNGSFLGLLNGADGTWSINSWPLTRDQLVNGSNAIVIDVDSTNAGCWCMGVGYLEVKARLGFGVRSYTPQDRDRNRDFRAGRLDLTVELTSEYDPATLGASAFRLESADASGILQPVAGTFQQTSPNAFRFTPASDLKDGVRYFATVFGGAAGVKRKPDGAQLPADLSWEFWTVPDLDRRADLFAGGGVSTCVPVTTSCDGLELAIFQVARNRTLIAGKDTASRVYLRWKKHADVFPADLLEDLTANVDLGSHGGSRVVAVRRPDLLTPYDKAHALNTVNFFDVPAADFTYRAEVEPRPQSNTPPLKFTKTRTLAGKPGQAMSFHHYFLKDADWAGGVPVVEEAKALTLFLSSRDYMKSQFPVTSVSPTFKGEISIGYTRTGPRKANGWYNVSCPPPLGGAPVVTQEDGCISLWGSTLLGGNRFVAFSAPGSINPAAVGFAQGQAFVGLANPQESPVVLAHEVGHLYSLSPAQDCGEPTAHRCDRTHIEGFNAGNVDLGDTSSGNKSHAEGVPLESLMHRAVRPLSFAWIDPSDYDILLGGTFSRPHAGGTHLVVTGVYTPQAGTGRLTSAFPQESPNPSTPGTALAVELLDGAGAVLASAAAGVASSPHVEDDAASAAPFSVSLPWSASAQRLRLRAGATTLDTLIRTAAPPAVTFTGPAPGDVLTGPVTFFWTATDADSPAVAQQLQLSTDGGTTFTPLGVLSTASSLSLDTKSVPSGVGRTFRVMATDGFNTAYASRSFQVVNPLTVAGSMPADGSTGVDPASPVTVAFASDVNPATLLTAFDLRETGTTNYPPGTASYDAATRTLTFRPRVPLRPGVSHTLEIPATVADVNGNILGASFRSSFTTAPDTAGPLVLGTSPAAGERRVPLSTLVAAFVSEPLHPASVTASSLQLLGPGGSPVAGTVAYNAVGQQAVFVPASPLAATSTYTARLTTVSDALGNPMATPREWTFRTGTTASSVPLRIVGNHLDVPLDLDGDGRYDTLDVWTDVEVRAAGTYNLNGRLTTSLGDLLEWQSSGYYDLPPGVYSLPLSFTGAAIRNGGTDGPYLLGSLNFYSPLNANYLQDSRASAFATSAYRSGDFEGVLTLSGLPDQLLERGTTRNDAFDLRSLSAHESQPVSSLTYSVYANTEPAVGVSIDAAGKVDLNPAAAVEAESDVTIEARDTLGNRALATFHVSVQAARPSALTAVQAPRRMSPGETRSIAFDIGDQFGRPHVAPVSVGFQVTQGSVSPTSATSSSARAATSLTAPAATTTLFLTAAAGSGSAVLAIDVNRLGDVDANGAVDVFDLVVMSGRIVGNVDVGQAPFLGAFSAGDLDGNGLIDVFDLVRLASCIVGNGC